MRATIVMLLLTIIGGMILWVAQGSGEENYERGKNLFLEKCQLCHGKGGEGNGPGAIAFDPKPANFTDPKFWKKMNDDKIAHALRHGKGMMPAFNFSSEQIKAIIVYLKHFKK